MCDMWYVICVDVCCECVMMCGAKEMWSEYVMCVVCVCVSGVSMWCACVDVV